MNHTKMELWPEGMYQSKDADGLRPTLTAYILDGDRSRGAVLICPKRWITRRQEDPNEAYFSTTLSEFVEKIKAGSFFVWWEAYGYLYGIDQEIQTQLKAGVNVVLNVSRKVVPELRQRYPDTIVIRIDVAPEKTAERLAKRSRGAASEIGLRLERAESFKDFQDWDICFNNDGDLESRGREFTALFREILAPAQ